MVPGPKKMVVGFNHNIKHAGRLFHVQTEDSGLDNPHVITHLFVGGNILASKKTSYADIVGADNLADVVRELMEEQHKEMLRNLINGVYDGVDAGPAAQQAHLRPVELVSGGKAHTAGALHPAQPSPPAPARKPASSSPPREREAPASLVPEEGETLFGEDLISEKSLDEVILSYLAEDLGDRKP